MFEFFVEDLKLEARTTLDDLNKFEEKLKKIGINMPSELAAHFLISSANDDKLAEDTAKKYFEIRSTNPIFEGKSLSAHDVQMILEITQVCVIPKRTESDNIVVIFTLIDDDHKKFDFTSFVKTMSMVLDLIMLEYPSTGLIALIDIHKMGFHLLPSVNVKTTKGFVDYLQEGLPANLKAIHLLNVNFLVEKIVILLKPLIKESLRNMLFVHPKCEDQKEIAPNFLEKSCLPEEFGGTQPSMVELHQKTIQKMKSLEEFYEIEEVISKKYKKFSD